MTVRHWRPLRLRRELHRRVGVPPARPAPRPTPSPAPARRRSRPARGCAAVAPGAPLTAEPVVGALAVVPAAGAPSGAPGGSANGAESAAGVSSATTCVSDICGFFLESADIHQIAPATANTTTTTNAGATNLLESGPAGALTMRVRSGCPTLARLE